MREISKLHEECVTGTLAELAQRYAEAPPKGEIVIVVGPPPQPEAEASDEALDDALCKRHWPGSLPSRAAAEVADRLGVPRKRAYARALDLVAMNRRRIAEERGRRAETLACWYLRLKGWPSSSAAPECAAARSTSSPGAAAPWPSSRSRRAPTRRRSRLALDHYRLRRVAAAAEQLAPRFLRAGDDIRIDAIFMVPGRWPRHLANVWQG